MVNGHEQRLPTGATVADVVERLRPGGQGVAVAVNGEVVTRATWRRHALAAGDRVEVLGASQGG